MGRIKVKTIKSIKDLLPDELNANKGSVRGRAMLEDSISEYGVGRSLLADRNGKLIAGNKTAEVLADVGLEDVIVVQTDGTKAVVVQRTDLDMDADPHARELALFDNRSNEVSLTWDGENLQKLQQQGVDTLKAFDQIELDNIQALTEANAAAAAAQLEAPPEFPSFDEKLNTEHRCPKCGYEWSGKAK